MYKGHWTLTLYKIDKLILEIGFHTEVVGIILEKLQCFPCWVDTFYNHWVDTFCKHWVDTFYKHLVDTFCKHL